MSRTLMCAWIGQRDDRIGEDGEIGPGADAIDDIGAGGVAGVEMGGGGGGEVAAGAEAHDADFGGIDMIPGGADADRAERALRIVDHGRVAILGAETIAEDESGNALRVEPLGNLLAFVIDGERAVSATGADNTGFSVRVLSNPGRERGDVLFLRALSARRAAGPEWEGGRVRRLPLGEQSGGGEDEEERLGHWGNDSAGIRRSARSNTMLVYGSGEFNR